MLSDVPVLGPDSPVGDASDAVRERAAGNGVARLEHGDEPAGAPEALGEVGLRESEDFPTHPAKPCSNVAHNLASILFDASEQVCLATGDDESAFPVARVQVRVSAMSLEEQVRLKYVALIDALASDRHQAYGWKAQVARLLGVSQGYLGRLHSGQRKRIGWDVVARATVRLDLLPSFWIRPEIEPSSWRDHQSEPRESIREAERLTGEYVRLGDSEVLALLGAIKDEIVRARPDLRDRDRLHGSPGVSVSLDERGAQRLDVRASSSRVPEVIARVTTALAMHKSSTERAPGYGEWLRGPVAESLTESERAVLEAVGWLFASVDRPPSPQTYTALWGLLASLERDERH
ncbi:MAG: hypothetical protein AAGH15_21290 [Myxococcota bacterium]